MSHLNPIDSLISSRTLLWSLLPLALACSSGKNARVDQYVPPEKVVAAPWTPPSEAPAGSPVAAYGALRVEGTELLDQDGQAVQLKGLSSMWLNWESKPFSQSKQGLAWLRDNWQMRVFRAAMGVEAAGGYLSSPDSATAKVTVIVRNAIDLGLYVIIDWHDHHAHLNEAQSIAFFTKMATEFGKYPNVIYEPFNEPNCLEKVDNCRADARATWPTIKAYHEKVVAAIRAVDPDNLIILGTPTWSQDVDKAAADPLQGVNLMYTLHFYSCTHQQWLIDRAEASLKQGLPIFVTEWGATQADGGTDGKVCLSEAQAWHDWMNQRYISSAAWKFDTCSDTSCIFNTTSGAGVNGDWTDANIAGGHGPFVRARMRDPSLPRAAGLQFSTGGVAPTGSAAQLPPALTTTALPPLGSAAASGSARPGTSASAATEPVASAADSGLSAADAAAP